MLEKTALALIFIALLSEMGACPSRAQDDDPPRPSRSNRRATKKQAEANTQEGGPGRLLRARGSSWIWFLDSFGTRHRIASTDVLKKWWASGPKVEEISSSELEKYRSGEEIDYGATPYTYVISRDSRVIKARLGNDPLAGQLKQLLKGNSPSSQSPRPPEPEPSQSASPVEEKPSPSSSGSEPTPTPASVREGTVIITSSPSGARVVRTADQHYYGETPLTLSLKPGPVSLSLSAKGYLTGRKKFILKVGQTLELPVKLRPKPAESPMISVDSQSVSVQPVPIGEVEVLLRSSNTELVPGLTQVFRLSLPGQGGACVPYPSRDRAAGLDQKDLWILTIPREGPFKLRRIVLPDALQEQARIAWSTDRDLLITDASDRERYLLNTYSQQMKPAPAVVAKTVNSRALTWLRKSDLSSRPEATKMFVIREVPGNTGQVAGLALSPDRRLLAGVSRESPRRPVIMSMATGNSITLPEPGEDLSEASLDWLTGDRILVTVPSKGSFVLSLEAMRAREVLEIAVKLAKAGQSEAAASTFDRLLRHYPTSGEAQVATEQRALIEQRLKVDRAATLVRKAKELAIQENHSAAINELNKALALGDVPVAQEAKVLLAEFETARAEAALKAAREAEAKDAASAVPLYKNIVRTAPPSVRQKAEAALSELGQKLQQTREQEDRKAIEDALARAQAARKAGDLSKAREILQEARRERPNAKELSLRAAEIDEASRQEKEKEDRARKTVTHYTRALALAHQGHLAEAAEAAGAALKEDPSHEPSQKLLAELSSATLEKTRALSTQGSPSPVPAETPRPGASPATPGSRVAAQTSSPGSLQPDGASPSAAPAGPSIRFVDVLIHPGTAWVYSLGPGTLARQVVGPVKVGKEIGVLVRDVLELPGVDRTERYAILVSRPSGLFVLGRGPSASGPFRAFKTEEIVFQYPVASGSSWVTARGHAQVQSSPPVSTVAGTYSTVLAVEEAVKNNDPFDVGTKLLTYRKLYAPGVGLIRQTLKRNSGPDRPILELTSFTPGKPSTPDTAATTGAGNPESPAPEIDTVRLEPPLPERGKASSRNQASPASAAVESPSDTAAGDEVSEEEALLKDKGESHFQQAQEQLKKRFHIEARMEIEAALSFDPGNQKYLDLKQMILAGLVEHSPYKPVFFQLGIDLAEVLLAYGAPDRIEPLASTLTTGRHSIPFDLVLTYRGGPSGTVPSTREQEGPNEGDTGELETTAQMLRWRLYIKSGRVVARQVSIRGDYQKATFPSIGHVILNEITSHIHAETEGPVANTRVLSWDLGVVHLKASVLALPRRKYTAKTGYTFEPARGIQDYRLTRVFVYVDPDTDRH